MTRIESIVGSHKEPMIPQAWASSQNLPCYQSLMLTPSCGGTLYILSSYKSILHCELPMR